MEDLKQEESIPEEDSPHVLWKIIGAVLVVGGAAMLSFATLPFVFGLILMYFGIMMFLHNDIVQD